MKVCLINHSDTRGGASMASLRMLEALQKAGVDVRMIVKQVDGLSRPDIESVGGSMRDRLCFVSERAHIYLANGFDRKNLFKVSTAACGLPVHEHPWVKDADIVVLNWFNQGMMSLNEIRRINKPIVWVMHDMWAMTGICHHSFGCERFMKNCGDCPFLGKFARPHDLSYKIFKKKEQLYCDCYISFVAVSQWLGDMALQSSLLCYQEVSVINNPFPIDGYSSQPSVSRSELGLPENKRLIILCAARLDDPVKNLPAAIDAVNHLAEEGCDDIALVLVGEIRDRSILESLKVPFCDMGIVSDQQKLRNIFSNCDVVLSSSRFETLGYTLIEGLASGAIAVAFGGDGRDDIIDHLNNGYLARRGDIADLAEGIRWALEAEINRDTLRRSVAEKFGDEVIARRYIQLFENLLK